MAVPADTHFYTQPSFWVSIVAAIFAGLSAFNSWHSRKIARRALAISQNQEERRQPHLEIYFADGYRRYIPTKQIFGFMLSVMNRSDSNNSIAMAELKVEYLIGENHRGNCRVPHNREVAEQAVETQTKNAKIFAIPERVDSHQTIAGWLFFALDNKIIGGKTIDRHTIMLTDSHGTVTETEPIAVKEWMNETPKNSV
jgi:hypothetical protein